MPCGQNRKYCGIVKSLSPRHCGGSLSRRVLIFPPTDRRIANALNCLRLPQLQVSIAVDLKVLPLPELSVQVPVTVTGAAVAFRQVAIPALGPGTVLDVKLTSTGSETDQVTFDRGGPSCRHPEGKSGTAPNWVVFAGGAPLCATVALGGITRIAVITVQLVPQLESIRTTDSKPANVNNRDCIRSLTRLTCTKLDTRENAGARPL